jgi:hypothetical protein
VPPAYYSESLRRFYFVTNGIFTSNSFLPTDMRQKVWPVYNWTLNVTNHVVYALFDGVPNKGGALLDFVNLGPFGASLSLTNAIYQANFGNNNGLGTSGANTNNNYWAAGLATSLPGSPMSQGVFNQIANGESVNENFALNLLGHGTGTDAILDCPYTPTYMVLQPTNWVVNDPLVHYTIDDLVWTLDPSTLEAPDLWSPTLQNGNPPPPLTNSIGKVSARYSPWGHGQSIAKENADMLFKDPLIAGSVDWQFPTNKFPGVGWIGRVHRGTPWQTVYLKADNPLGTTQPTWGWSNWVNSPWFVSYPANGVVVSSGVTGGGSGFVSYEAAPETYPTNDWALVDLFTAVPNDNAARGLVSVNQANDAAWAAVFAGVITISNGGNGVPVGVVINPSNDVEFLMDATNGINAIRTNQPNGVFHKVGNILAASALTTYSPFLGDSPAAAANYSDDVVERIPQQVLSLLRVGEPQFAIFAWGQALKPKGPPYLPLGPDGNKGIYTNYQITGEFLSRTICHVVHTNGMKMVIDNYTVEPGN